MESKASRLRLKILVNGVIRFLPHPLCGQLCFIVEVFVGVLYFICSIPAHLSPGFIYTDNSIVWFCSIGQSNIINFSKITKAWIPLGDPGFNRNVLQKRLTRHILVLYLYHNIPNLHHAEYSRN